MNASTLAKKHYKAARLSMQKPWDNSPVGIASDYFYSIHNLIKRRHGKRIYVILYCRVSEREQHRKKNILKQIAWCLAQLREMGVIVLYVVREVVSGWHQNRFRLDYAIELARKYGAVLVAESSCRLLRSRRFHTIKRPDALPSHWEYSRLIFAGKDVNFATILPPDLGWKDVRSHQTRRGQKDACPPGEKRNLRREYLPTVLQLRKAGYSYDEIVRFTGLVRSSVRRWVSQYGEVPVQG